MSIPLLSSQKSTYPNSRRQICPTAHQVELSSYQIICTHPQPHHKAITHAPPPPPFPPIFSHGRYIVTLRMRFAAGLAIHTDRVRLITDLCHLRHLASLSSASHRLHFDWFSSRSRKSGDIFGNYYWKASS